MRIGIVTALAEEMTPIYETLGDTVAEGVIHGVIVKQIKNKSNVLYLATGGVGEINAATTVQMLVDLFDVDVILNFGFVGALSKNLKPAEMVIVDRVCYYQFDTSKIDGTAVGQYIGNDDIYFYLDGSLIDRVLSSLKTPYKRVTAASGDKFVASAKEKTSLVSDFGADICEMELAGLAIACRKNNVPLLSVKVVSDSADENAVSDFNAVASAGIAKYSEVMQDILDGVCGDNVPLPPVKKGK